MAVLCGDGPHHGARPDVCVHLGHQHGDRCGNAPDGWSLRCHDYGAADRPAGRAACALVDYEPLLGCALPHLMAHVANVPPCPRAPCLGDLIGCPCGVLGAAFCQIRRRCGRFRRAEVRAA